MLYLTYKVCKFIIDQFKKPTPSGLELYIASKKPQTTSEVERLMREYTNKHRMAL